MSFLFNLNQQPPRATLFPYTTLFRSEHDHDQHGRDLRQPPLQYQDQHDPGDPDGGRGHDRVAMGQALEEPGQLADEDRKSTRLNSSHMSTSYAVFCLKKKTSILPSLV